MISVWIFIPHHEGDDVNVYADLPAVPRVGDTVVHSAIAHTVADVTWDVDECRVTVRSERVVGRRAAAEPTGQEKS